MNDSSFEYFYRKYVDQISRYISTHYQIDTDASRDVAQEVFIVLWEKHEEIYDKEEKRVLSWLYETAKRKAMAYNRQESKIPIDEGVNLDDFTDEYTAKYDDLIYVNESETQDEKYKRYIGEIKKQLKKKDLTMFELVVEKKLEPKEVIKIMGISDINFRVRWHRLRNNLKKIVSNILYK